MEEELKWVGRVLSASTATFSMGCRQLISEQNLVIPEFGALVKAHQRGGDGEGLTYGLIYNVAIEDDPLVRQLVSAGVEDETVIEDQRQNRQVPIVVDVQVVGCSRGGEVLHRLPPQPPSSLDRIYPCVAAELVRFTERHDWIRSILQAKDVPADELLPAALRMAAAARPLEQRETYLLEAGRQLARLLALELPRLDGMLRQLR